jgi:hypothetical protein
MVVLKRLAEQPMEASPAENDDVVKELTSHGVDEALRKAVLPWAAVAGTKGLRAHSTGAWIRCWNRRKYENANFARKVLEKHATADPAPPH